MMVLRCIGLVLLAGFTGCKDTGSLADLKALQARGEVIRVACLGDSLTRMEEPVAYPTQLQRMLGPGWEVRNFGLGLSTVLSFGDLPYLKSREFEDALTWAPHAVIILLGTNDSKPRHWYYKKEFECDYRRLVRRLMRLPSRPAIWIAYPPSAFPGQWGIRDSVIRDEMIPVLRGIAYDVGLPTIDLYGSFRGHPEMFPDQIHPNEQGLALLAEAVHKTLLAELRP